jgi:hypothetical protein
MRTDHDHDRLARRRASAKMGWYIHALVFVAVNLGLAFISATSGRNWVMFPTLGWGLGLLIHGLVVFAVTGRLHATLVRRERAALERDPW